MSVWQAMILGLIQGLTEFLPVSSSGHLALAQMLIPGFHQPGVVFDAMLHVGTAAAVVWAERRLILRWLTTASGWRLIWFLALGTVATGVFGLPLRHVAEAGFGHAEEVGIFLLITGAIVLSTRFLTGRGSTETNMTWKQAAGIGLAQGLAVFPGLSRSGTTIAAGLGIGLDRSWAARFSFLLSVPAIAGATLVEVVGNRGQLAASGHAFWIACFAGAVTAGISGYVALGLVIRTVTSRSFHRFAWYCLPVGLLVIVLGLGGLL